MSFAAVTISKYSQLNSAAILVDDEQTQAAYVEITAGVAQDSGIYGTDTLHVVRIVAVDADLWVQIGPTPTAAVGNDFLILTGTTEYFSIGKGEQISLFEAL